MDEMPMNRRAATGPLAVCVATNRPAEAAAFLDTWAPYLSLQRTRSGNPLSVFIHEDHPQITRPLPTIDGIELVHTCQADLEPALGGKHWVIPRGSGASRSFPLYLAWKRGAEYIISMDDDCFPPEREPERFFTDHLSAFGLDRWFRTIDGELPRGIPYGDRGVLPVLLNHGVWTGVPDLDGPTALVRERWPVNILLRSSREVIPQGMWFPLCAMNVCYHRSAIPAAYNLLMGLASVGFDRFDDIWSGLFLKRIADHLGVYVTNGTPFVRHMKASNIFGNLRKEALGIHLHEDFWKHTAAAPLGSAPTVGLAYKVLADWVEQFPRACPKAPSPNGYFEKLAEAMRVWASLFAS